MAAKGSDIRRLAADMQARGKAERDAGSNGATTLTQLAAYTMPVAIIAVLLLTVLLAISAVVSGGFLGLGGWTALGAVSLVGTTLINTVWLRDRTVDGFRVTQKSAPELYALVADAAQALGASRPHSILVTDTFTVKLHHLPRLGLLAGTSSVLEIGLPAIQTYARDELAVFITQELARVGSARDAGERQVERMADLWTVAMSKGVRPSLPLDFLAGAFGAWIAPRLDKAARTARANGALDADRASAELIGAPETARALQRRAIAVSFLDEYWHRLADEPIETPTPTFQPYREMAEFMPRIGEWEQCEAALRLALVNRPLEAGAEPALHLRLKALGQRPSMPITVMDPATALLGAAYEPTIQHFDTRWQKANATAWAKAYAEQHGPAAAAAPAIAPAAAVARPTAVAVAAAPDSAAAYADAMAPAELPLQDGSDGHLPQMLTESHGTPSAAEAIAIALQAEAAEGFEGARDRYVDACEWHPENGRVWVHFAAALLRASEEETVEAIEQALGLVDSTDWDVEDGQVWFTLGKALLEAGEQGGVVCLEQAIAIDPALTDEALFIADGFVDQEEPAEAADAYAAMPFDDTGAVVPLARTAPAA